MNKDVGKNAEREIVSILRDYGFKSVRIPTSNSSPNPLPDVFATLGEVLIAIEVKSTWEPRVKVRWYQVSKVLEFLDMFQPMRGIPLVAVKFKHIHSWKVVELSRTQEDVVVSHETSEYLEDFLQKVSHVGGLNRREEFSEV